MRNILVLAAAASLLAACSSEEKKPASSGPAQAGYSIPANDPLPIYDSPTQAAPSASSSAGAAAPTSVGSTVEYTVVSGDSLWKIARQHKTTVEKIMLANDLRTDVIKPGQKLLVPVP